MALHYSVFGSLVLAEEKKGRRKNNNRTRTQKPFPFVCGFLHIRRGKAFTKKSSGCVACYKTPKVITTADVPSNGLKRQGKAVTKPSMSDYFWTTSTPHNMDNSAGQSHGSMSSTSATNQTLVSPHGGSCKTSNPNEFVNHGLVLWNQTRRHWVGNKRSKNRSRQSREPKLSWNATYENLLGSNKPFQQPVSLAEMIDFLVDTWEQEGLYD